MKKAAYAYHRIMASAVIAGAGLMASASYAQEARADAATPSSEEIIVTGSRVAANGNQQPTPVTVVSADELLATVPTTVSDGLKQLPAFGGSNGNRTLNNSGSNNTGSFLNLRNLGPARTLTLMDGRRVAGASVGGAVDTNTLPQLLISRVDVATGGVAAVYGTDAVAGVVNFILDKNFNGVKAVAQGGISEFGDGQQARIGVAAGTKIGDGGHLEVSFDHYRSNGLSSQLERPNGAAGWVWQTTNGVAKLVPNGRVYGAAGGSFGGQIVSGSVFNGQQFVAPGVIGPFQQGTPARTTTSGSQSGGDGVWAYTRSILADLDYDQAFARFDQDFGDVQGFVQAGFSRVKNRNNFFPQQWDNLTFASDNGFLPAYVSNALLAAGETTFRLSKFIETAPPQKTDSTTDTFSATMGFEGKFADKFDWSLFYSYGRNKLKVVNFFNPNRDRRAAALDAVDVGLFTNGVRNGQVVCRVTLTNPGLYPGCVPINPFGPGSENATSLRYMSDDTFFNLTNEMHDVGGALSGDVFDTWAGPVKAALSFEVRRMSVRNESSAQPAPVQVQNCTGLRFNCTAGVSLYRSDTTTSFKAAQTIKEGALEVGVPLLRDVTMFRSLDLTGAVRFANYSVSGNATTWKVGVDWTLFDGLRFRGTRSRDIRAPTLNDLFAPLSTRPLSYIDQLAKNPDGSRVQRSIDMQVIGNPNLTPEVANTLTFGAVATPAFLPGFSLAVDYYRVKLKNGITTLSGNDLALQDQCIASGGTLQPICSLWDRPFPYTNTTAANFPTTVRSTFFNFADTEVEGVDAEANYRFQVNKVGDFNLRLLGTYQPVVKTRTFSNQLFQNVAGSTQSLPGIPAGTPKYRLVFNATYQTGPLTVNWQTRWRSSLAQAAAVRPWINTQEPRVPSASFSNLAMTWDTEMGGAKVQFFGNVQNVFDKVAPIWNVPFSEGLPGFNYPALPEDDVMGRYYTAGVRVQF